MAKKIRIAIGYIFFTAFITLYYLSLYINVKFDDIPFDQLLFTLIYNKGSDTNVVINGLIYIIPKVLITLLIFITIQIIIKKYIINNKKEIYLRIKIINKNIKYKLFNFTLLKRVFLYILVSLVFITLIFKYLRIGEFIINKLQKSDIYERYYVDPHNISISFNEKRNLVYIVLESEEMTNASIQNGGGVEKSYIPKLEQLAKDNINFSNKDNLGGAIQVTGATYTAASLVSQTSGTPVSVSLDANSYHGYSSSYPGLYSLGEILSKNGYKNYFLLGSDADFGGRSDYFTIHGNYKVMDYKYAVENKWIDSDYKVWWGYEDKKLFEFAKKELTEIAKNDEPFNFTILTADTHFLDGYYDETCGDMEFSNQYESVFYCNDNMIYEFVSWLQKQDFYENTTIIISGDHLTMQGGFYTDLDYNYQRTVYNTIINSGLDDSNSKNRLFSVLDLYPTTLRSIGAEVDGNKLGFGVDLFSGEKTMLEIFGIDYINGELAKNSTYYNEKILGNTYYEVNNKVKE